VRVCAKCSALFGQCTGCGSVASLDGSCRANEQVQRFKPAMAGATADQHTLLAMRAGGRVIAARPRHQTEREESVRHLTVLTQRPTNTNALRETIGGELIISL